MLGFLGSPRCDQMALPATYEPIQRSQSSATSRVAMTEEAIRLAAAVVRAMYRSEPALEERPVRRGSLVRVV
jgi:hypothetical protein